MQPSRPPPKIFHRNNDPTGLSTSARLGPTGRGVLQKYGKFRPKFHGSAKSLVHAFEFAANENTVLLLAASASHLSPPGLVILPLADAEVTWKILVVWRRVRACGALKALLDALLTVTPKGSEAKWIL